MARKYKKRTKSTKPKSYADYLRERAVLEDKGYFLKDVMSKSSFEEGYERIKGAKRAGEIKSQPWQHLMAREKYVNTKQAKALEVARRAMGGKLLRFYDLQKMGKDEIKAIGLYLNKHKEELFGGNYE